MIINHSVVMDFIVDIIGDYHQSILVQEICKKGSD